MENTRVVNVRVAYIRPQFHNFLEWCEDPNNIYIGRAHAIPIDGVWVPSKPSPFANPFKLADCKDTDDCLARYKRHLLRILKNPAIERQFEQLIGKNLGCWCAPNPCHGHIIVEVLRQMYSQSE